MSGRRKSAPVPERQLTVKEIKGFRAEPEQKFGDDPHAPNKSVGRLLARRWPRPQRLAGWLGGVAEGW